MVVSSAWCFVCIVFRLDSRLAKAPLKSDRILRLSRQIRPLSSCINLKRGSADDQSRHCSRMPRSRPPPSCLLPAGRATATPPRRRRKSLWPLRSSRRLPVYFEFDRQHGGDQHGRSRRPRAGLCAGDQLYRRRFRQKGHLVIHHRAGTVQAQGRGGEGGSRQRQGQAEAGRSRVPASGRSGDQAGLDPGQLRQGAGAARSRRRPICNRQRPTNSRRRSTSVIPT